MSKAGFVTAADVAKLAGVSRSAVSRTFTPDAYVSPAVREKVLRAADELGYRVNRLAKDLQTSRSSMVAIVGARFYEPYVAGLLDDLSAALIGKGLHALLLNASSQDMTALLNLVLEYRVRAVIVLSGAPPRELIDQCLRARQRMILINRHMEDVEAGSIETDDRMGGRLAAEHLLAAGRRKLCVVRSGADTPSQRRRAAGFLERLDEEGIACERWVAGRGNYEAGCEAARSLLRGSGPVSAIDGVFAATDRTALGFLNTARFEMGVSVPQDVAVIGFDDIPEAAWSSHNLTTIRQSAPDVVAAVLTLLAEDDEDAGPRRVAIPVSLVERGTV
ncbi:MAG: LacI family DNA-binding transcriptional regulator [Pannonibacter phragmitetus]|uniref:LacI family DNA-binding transcriptional regulator n=1 Tax=Pannonibacter phragmitetus TaxID=121719 RepID=UPI000F45A284|nr:LacI family DNA-binding transcriptional regulator [Pannonibacter phragmitetus]MBA4207768.1 LacI family transcriptional regulator [Polymorphum sp.]